MFVQKEKVFSRITQTQAYQTVFPSQSSTSSSPVLDNLCQHLDGELPSYQPNSEIASETAPDISVSEIQQQLEAQQQMASETCTTIIIHPNFKPDTPRESHFGTTSTEHVESSEQSASNVNISVSEDQTYVVQPLNAVKPKNTLQTTFDILVNKPFILELVL